MADRKERVILDLNAGPYVRGLATASTATRAFVADLDTGNDRATMLTQTLLALGPATVPVLAAATPAFAGLTSQLGFAAAGAGVLALGFNGVGDALTALREYQANPTEESLAKLNETMAGLGPEAQEFVAYLDEIMPRLQSLREEAQTALPGFADGLDEMMDRLPQVRDIIGEVADASGRLAAEAGENLASDDWNEFFDFLENEAQDTLLTFGRTVGNVFEGLANTWMALDPLSDGFASSLLDWSRDFSEATENLDENDRFQGFLDYVQTNGPRAAEALGALGGAVVSLVEAAAPVGAATLPVIEGVADVFSTIVDSPAGPVLIAGAAGISAVSRAIGVYNAANGSALLGFLRGAKTDGGAAGKGLVTVGNALTALRGGAAILGSLALAYTDLDDKAGVSNTAMLATMGLVQGPWGAAIGGGVGLLMDLAAANDDLEAAIAAVNRESSRANMQDLRAELDATYDSITQLGVEVSQGDWLEALRNVSLWDMAGDGFTVLSGSAAEARAALDETRTSAEQFRDFGALMTGPMGITSAAFEGATQSVEEFTNATLAAFGLLDKRASLRAARDAVRAFNDLLDESPDKLKRGTAAYDDAEAALDDIASSSLKAAENLKGMARVEFLDRQRGQFIAAAEAMGLTSRQARNLADRLGLLDKTDAKPKIDADDKDLRRKLEDAEGRVKGFGKQRGEAKLDADHAPLRRKVNDAFDWFYRLGRERPEATIDADNRPAKRKTDDAFDWLYALNRERAVPKIDGDASGVTSAAAKARAELRAIPDETVYIRVQRTVSNLAAGIGGMFSGSADGSRVPKTGLPYADRHPYLLADGEWITSNRRGQADRFDAELGDINAGLTRAEVFNRMLARGLAEGGTTGRSYRASEVVRPAGPLWTHELGQGITTLTHELDGLSSALVGSSRGLKFELKQRLEALTAERDAHKARLDMWEQEQASLAEAIRSRYTASVFGDGADLSGTGLSAEQQAAMRATMQRNRLTSDIAELEERIRLTRRLENKGLDGRALADLMANGSIEDIRAYAGMSRAALGDYEDDYEQRARLARRAGAQAGEAAFGAYVADARAEVRESNKELRAVNKRLENVGQSINRLEKTGPERTGRAAAKGTVEGMTKTVVAGFKGRR